VTFVARAVTLGLVLYTVLAMAWNPGLGAIIVLQFGPLPLYVFDVLLLAATAAFFYVIALRTPTDPCPANRVVLRSLGAYMLYQVIVVAPLAVFWFDIGVGETYALLVYRFGLALVPFFYYVGLRYIRPEKVVALVNAAALCLLVWAAYRYAFVGPEGFWEGGVFRLRVLWGGSTLLFGWLAVAGLSLERTPVRAYAFGIAGILGVVLINHRSGYVALLVAFLAYIFVSRQITRRLVVVVALSVIGGIALTAISPALRENVTYSLSTMLNARSDATAWDRVERTSLAWDYVQEHPLGDYIWNRQYYRVNLGSLNFEPHNFVIQVLDKQGWISSGFLFVFLGAALWAGWTIRTKSRLARAMTVYVVFYLTFCLFNTNLLHPENVMLLTLATALILWAHRGEENVGQPTPVARDPGPRTAEEYGPRQGDADTLRRSRDT